MNPSKRSSKKDNTKITEKESKIKWRSQKGSRDHYYRCSTCDSPAVGCTYAETVWPAASAATVFIARQHSRVTRTAPGSRANRVGVYACCASMLHKIANRSGPWIKLPCLSKVLHKLAYKINSRVGPSGEITDPMVELPYTVSAQ
jgi:hypothetical protein